jgi:tricarballylate dehydrogenase
VTQRCDVVVVGAGSAAICAALAARETGAQVVLLERAPVEERGGNTAFTGGALRMVYHGVDELTELVPDVPAEQLARTDFGEYTARRFYDDLARVTEYRGDPDLLEIMVDRSYETYLWLRRNHGIRFGLMYGRQAFEVDGRFTFFGGLAVEAWGGGPEYSKGLFAAAERAGIDIRYSSRATKVIRDGNRAAGVVVRAQAGSYELLADAVVLAAGGFQGNVEWRSKYLGTGWDLANVRGSRFNTGDGLQMALDVDAMPFGQWTGCHAVGQDINAPAVGDLAMADGYEKHSYPFGIMVNADGKRFVDEAADFRNYTYAKYGRQILQQPGGFAWQIFDQKSLPYLRDEYHLKGVTKVSAPTLEELARKLEGVDREGVLATVAEFNAAVQTDVPFNPNVLDGRGTQGLAVRKSNWAQTIDEGPFEAYGVSVGLTFTFGGVRIDNDARVIDTEGVPIPGLFAAGEMVGGIFYYNYPAGSGLTSGAVFGRIAGTSAAAAVNAAATTVTTVSAVSAAVNGEVR